MDGRNEAQAVPAALSAGMDHSEELLAEVDEPPDELNWSPTKLRFGYMKTHPSMNRRESLLTRQLNSETEHTDDDTSQPGRAMSTQSTWSTHSATSMTELTSDDGRSVHSPAVSPPLPPTLNNTTLPIHEMPLEQKVKILGQDDVAPTNNDTTAEKTVEANLGRKRCISFACKGKQEPKPAQAPTSQPAQPETTEPPKRKCMLKFVCPTKAAAENKSNQAAPAKRPVSPPPPVKRSSSKPKHRGSDSTVTHVSPKAVRRTATPRSATPRLEAVELAVPPQMRRYSIDSDDESGKEATRFHEFATSEDEPEEWVQESTCHRSRLTVNDTLKKENFLRKTCEEAEEEVLEEEDEEDEAELDDELVAGSKLTEDEAEDESDEGFHSDDEGGFASSDSERDDDSDFEWWKPGGASTAATSVEHLDRLAIVNSQHIEPGSSVNSISSAHLSPRASRISLRKTSSRNNRTPAISINRRGSVDLPDSTDFVCGTLDEDRPIEQAYINRKKAKIAAKRPSRPQDIDPSFPTSDPEMDEEDDDDVDEVPESEEDEDDFMHGSIDELDVPTARKSSFSLYQTRSNTNRSPPPPARVHSPPPKRTMARSPAPTKRARSPAPRKLFGHSPRAKSPMPIKRMTSPHNSPTDRTTPLSTAPTGLAGRPQPTHTASLPRNGPIALSKLAHWGAFQNDDDTTDTGVATEVPHARRGAIDIVKGVEWKRQRRKDKLHQKMCAKYAAKTGERAYKCRPGKGAERMREVGLQLQEYRGGKAEHILSL